MEGLAQIYRFIWTVALLGICMIPFTLYGVWSFVQWIYNHISITF